MCVAVQQSHLIWEHFVGIAYIAAIVFVVAMIQYISEDS